MAMIDWPDQIYLVLGDDWIGTNGMETGEIIILTVYSTAENELLYSEAGSDTADDDTNRLKIKVKWTVTMGAIGTRSMDIYASSSDSWDLAATFTHALQTGGYTFGDLYDHSPQSDLSSTCDIGWIFYANSVLNPKVFSSFFAYELPDTKAVDPLVIDLVPVAPAVVKTVSPTPLVIDLVPLTPLYVGEPTSAVSVSPLVIDLVPLAPTVAKIHSPDPVVVEIDLVRPTVARSVTPDPVVIDLVPVIPAYAATSPFSSVTVAPLVIDLVPVTPTVTKQYQASMSGLYRVFNAAEYRFFRTSDGSTPQEDDTPFAAAATLPDTPTDTFADGTWHISAAYFNGCLQSGFYPVDQGLTYHTLVIAGDVEQNPPPPPILVQVRQLGTGIVQVEGIYLVPDNDPYEWSIGYTTNEADPAEDTPTVTVAIAGGQAILSYALPAQTVGTTVKVRLQVRRNDGTTGSPVWVYSDGSVVHTVVIDTAPGVVTSLDWTRGRLD